MKRAPRLRGLPLHRLRVHQIDHAASLRLIDREIKAKRWLEEVMRRMAA